MIEKFFFAGSGGQGIILMGQMLAYAAMYEGKETTFLPSYGPEMRGGTANCTVVVSDRAVSCPLVYEADALIAMNLPSMVKFEGLLKRGGKLFLNSSLIAQPTARGDVELILVPVNDIAADLGNELVANMVMLGALVRSTGIVADATIEATMKKVFTGKKAALIPINMAAYHAHQT